MLDNRGQCFLCAVSRPLPQDHTPSAAQLKSSITCRWHLSLNSLLEQENDIDNPPSVQRAAHFYRTGFILSVTVSQL